ncbi:MAG: tRNA (guanosine(37)-N1)-methyltransferase TrmD, partial [Deltaproteobacteria bacterium]|nr:tRNA (guanosine(37)-N1)-methyltransferase TrmD [Deltaproteobacteria bacterium]
IIGRAAREGIIQFRVIDLKNFGEPPHYKLDDYPYGGGAGLVLKPEPLAKAILNSLSQDPQAKVIFLTPAGIPFSQPLAQKFSNYSSLIFVCGRYEGFDQRVVDLFGGLEITVGPFVVSGGELPALLVADCVARLLPNVLGNQKSVEMESFTDFNNLEAPQYTRPEVFCGMRVPDVLLSGNHKEIDQFRKELALTRYKKIKSNPHNKV